MENETTSTKSESLKAEDVSTDGKETGEKQARHKLRKYASRQAFQERRKIGSVGANVNLGFELKDRAFSISSESNTSHTELQGFTIKAESSFHRTQGHQGCAIWIESQLRNAIDQLMDSNAVQSNGARRVKIIQILESADESNWQKISSDYFDVAILYAALSSNSAMLQYFLQKGASPVAADQEGRTAMHYISCSSSSDSGPDVAECIALLHRHGAKVNVWDKHGLATPLMCASATGCVHAVEALLRCGADANAGLADPKYPDGGTTALIWAVRAKSLRCVKLLIEEGGAAVNSPQAYSEAPIHVAASQGDSECLLLLLEHHADVRVLLGRDRMSALHLAAEDGNVGCVRLLLQAKADCNVVNARGQTPLHLAALSQSAESVAALLDAGARLEIQDMDEKSPLHCAVIKSSRSTDIVKILIQAGADVNAADQFGYSPLHLAAINENSKVAAILLQSGADWSSKTKGGVTALSFLVRRVPDVLTTIPRRLDSAVVVADHDPLDPDCELHLDLRVLVPNLPRLNQHLWGETNLLVTLVEGGQRHILQHPIIRAFLHLKWFKIRSLFIVSLLFHAAFVLLISANILSIYVINIRDFPAYKEGNCSINPMTDTSSCCYTPWPEVLVDFFKYLVLIFAALSAVKEVFQLFQIPCEYLRNPENCIQIFIIAGVVLVNLPSDLNSYNWQHHLAALLIVVAWMELMMHVGRFPVIGLYVQMFTTVAANIARFLTAYLSLIIGFSLGFAVLYPKSKNLACLPFSLLTTFVMMTGELEYKDYFTEDMNFTWTTHLVFLAFLLFIVVVLMNLLVGLAVSDIQGLQKSAGLDRLVRQTRLIARMEQLVFSPWLNKLTCTTYSTTRKILQRNLLVVPPNSHRIYTLKPNDPRDDRFPLDIKEGILKILLTNKANQKGHHLISRTNTNLTNDTLQHDALDEIVSSVNHALTQIAHISASVEERLSNIEGRWVSIQKKLDTLVDILDHNRPLSSGQLSEPHK